MKRSIFYIIILLAGVSACKPIELPPDEIAVPKYTAFWTDQNGNTEVKAGIDGYQINSEAVFEDSVFVINSKIEQVDCFDDCGASLEFRFYDLENFSGSGIHPDLLQSNTNYPFTGAEITTPGDTSITWTVIFNALTEPTGGSMLNHAWTLHDSISFVGMNTFVYTALTDDPIDVCLTSTGNILDPACNTTQCRTISPVNGGPAPLEVKIGSIQGGTFLNAETTGGTAPYSFSWNNGEVTQSILLNSPGTYMVEVTDSNGSYASSSVATDSGGPASTFCSAYFEYTSQELLDITPGDTISAVIFGSVELIYEEEGARYFSKLGDQSPADFVIIDKVTEVETPNPGVELEIRFQVTLYEEVTLGEKVLSNGEATLFFELP